MLSRVPNAAVALSFFFSFSATQVQCIIVCQVFSFRILLVFPPPTAACLQSDVVKSTFISGNATTSPSLFAIWHLISLFFRSISYFLPCFIFLLGFLSKHGLLLVFGLWFWFLVFVCATTSATYRFTGTMTQKRVCKGLRAMNVHTFRKIQPRSLDRKFLINLRWNIKFALSLTVY